MLLRRALAHASILLPAALIAGCPLEIVHTLVDCRSAWVCGDQETAEDDNGDEDLCLDVNDNDRPTTIEEHTAELQADCNAIPVNCIGGEAAVCTATCTPTTTECGTDAGS